MTEVFNDYLIQTRNNFVRTILELYPHEQNPEDRLPGYAKARVSAEDMLIAFDQLKEAYFKQITKPI